jgi:hypothetical protein
MSTPFIKRGIWRSQWPTLSAGTAAAPSLSFTGDPNTGLFSPTADTFAVTTGGTERLRVDSAGNLGLGVTPSVWASSLSWRAIQQTGGSLWSAAATDFGLAHNSHYTAGGGWTYTGSAAAARHYMAGATHTWSVAASGTAGTAVTWTDAMRLDASRNLGLGTSTFGTSAATVFSIANGTEPSTGPANTVQFYSVDRSAGNTIPGIYCEGSGVTNAAITDVTVTNKIAIKVNGTVYYLLATTSAA